MPRFEFHVERYLKCSPEELMKMSKINTINLMDYPNGGLDVLVEVLQNNDALQCLGVCSANIAHEEFTNALANNRTIKRCMIHSHIICNEGAIFLANALKNNNNIEYIYLDWNDSISIENAKIIADALKVNRGIQKLGLNGYSFEGDQVEGLQILVDVLKENTSICDFTLVLDQIGNAGAKYLAEAIRVNRTLERISLWDRDRTKRIGAEGLAALAGVMTEDGSNDLEIGLNGISLKENWDVILIEHQNEIDKKNTEIERKNREIERKEREINMKNKEIKRKNKEIASLKAGITGVMQQHPIDLTADDENEPAAKRPRSDTATATKSKLAIMHEQNQKLVQVKQEKTVIEANLQTVTCEKNAMEAELEDTKEDLDIANETVQHQALATDIWQRRFDELAAMVTGRVDAAAVAEIRNRSLADQH